MALSTEERAGIREMARQALDVVLEHPSIGGNLRMLGEILAAERETADDAALGARVRAIVTNAEDGTVAA